LDIRCEKIVQIRFDFAMPRFEKFIVRAQHVENNEEFPGLLLFNPDAGRNVSKKRYYVFDKENYAETVKDQAECVVTCEVVKTYMSLEQVKNPEAPPPSSGIVSCTKVKIIEVAAKQSSLR
jgi:hypothetical protein